MPGVRSGFAMYPSDLPWGPTYSISLAAVTVDGEEVRNYYPIADKPVEIGTITLKPGESREGDYDIENVVQLSQAPEDKDIPFFSLTRSTWFPI